MKKLILFTGLVIINCGCSKKDLNLPQPSPMPVRSAPDVAANSTCSVQFSSDMSTIEIASTADKMRRLCHYSREDVLQSAQKIFQD